MLKMSYDQTTLKVTVRAVVVIVLDGSIFPPNNYNVLRHRYKLINEGAGTKT